MCVENHPNSHSYIYVSSLMFNLSERIADIILILPEETDIKHNKFYEVRGD